MTDILIEPQIYIQKGSEELNIERRPLKSFNLSDHYGNLAKVENLSDKQGTQWTVASMVSSQLPQASGLGFTLNRERSVGAKSSLFVILAVMPRV